MLAGPTGFEPAISSSTERHVNRYTTSPCLKLVEFNKINQFRQSKLQFAISFYRIPKSFISKEGSQDMPSFRELRERKKFEGKHLCVGLDPDEEKIPLGISVENFLFGIVNSTIDVAGCFKPNVAFFESMGQTGADLYMKLIHYIGFLDHEMPVIGDAKRMDIGNTNKAYTQAFYQNAGVGALTLNPYLGLEDAADVFLGYKEKTGIFLCRTSNKGARAIQDLPVYVGDDPIDAGQDHSPLFLVVARMVAQEWSQIGEIGLVAGATFPDDIARIRRVAPDAFLLIPAIGKQQGELKTSVLNAASTKGDFVINVSSGVIYASDDEVLFAAKAHHAAVSYHEQIQKILETV